MRIEHVFIGLKKIWGVLILRQVQVVLSFQALLRIPGRGEGDET